MNRQFLLSDFWVVPALTRFSFGHAPTHKFLAQQFLHSLCFSRVISSKNGIFSIFVSFNTFPIAYSLFATNL